MTDRPQEYYRGLVGELAKLGSETEWVEFKGSKARPEEVAEYISALSNSAALCGRPCGYLVWGVDDATHEVAGTAFDYRAARKGNEELEAWLVRMVNPKIGFSFRDVDMGGGARAVILTVPAAKGEPTRVGATAYIRVGSNKKPLAGNRELEARLWRSFDETPAEMGLAATGLSGDRVTELLDYPGYYRALGLPIPDGRGKVMRDLEDEGFVARNDAGSWDVTCLGALCVACDLADFAGLRRRSVRVVRYKGTDRTEGVGEREFTRGYALSHEEIVQYVMAVTPSEEVLDGPIRRDVTAFPEVAVREMLANAMVHQDLAQRGTNPMVEVFSNRIEFSNAGGLLVPEERIIDSVPVSRNEGLSSFMRKCGICEERGSGYDKIVGATIDAALIAPRVIDQGGMFTKQVLFSKVPFEATSKQDRVRTCYMLACLAYVKFSAIGNADVRKVFGLEASRKAQATRILKDTLKAGLVKPVDPEAAPKSFRYVPYWA